MVQLSEKDKDVIRFLAKYKIMLIEDAKLIYNSEWYHRKRIKKLADEGYIKRYKFYYIELDKKGRNLLGLNGKEYIKNKSNEVYMERLKQISRIGTITIDSDVKFTPSWMMKERQSFTDTARKYLGELNIGKNKYLVYFISNKKEKVYIHQLLYDINKVLEYDNIIIFVDSIEKLENEYENLTLKKEHIYIIENSKENRKLLKQYSYIDFYELVKNIYGEEKQILFSGWKLADYFLGNNHYVLNMLFLDVERLNELKWFYYENTESKKQIDIITLKENKKILKKLAPRKSRIIEIDNSYFLKGVEFEKMEAR